MITVTIIAKNEEKKIGQAIESVQWADEILVIDSGSTDGTVAIARQFQARVIDQSWLGYGKQKNFAQSLAKNDWVLNIDADERVPASLKHEILQAIQAHPEARGFSFPRKTFYLGRWIQHGGWYPNRIVRLARRQFATWTEPELHECLQVDGPVIELQEPLEHFSFDSIQYHVFKNLQFAQLAAQDLKHQQKKPSIFKLLFKPWGKFLEVYFYKMGFLDGLAGWVIAINSSYCVFLRYAFLLESKIRLSKDP